MSEPKAHGALGDLLMLLKPGILGMAVFTAAGAHLLAPGPVDGQDMALALLGIGALVGAASALNQHAERETDSLMERTRSRPLPAGRMDPRTCLAFGLVLAALSLGLLAALVNAVTAFLGALALAVYVLVYTPLKRRTPAALVVGAVPGAMPVLLGWTSATGRVDPGGVALFLVLFAWQIPHFIAISAYRQKEYESAGLVVIPTLRGLEAARREALAYTAALVPVSFAPVALGLGGWAYSACALAAGAWLVVLAARRGEPVDAAVPEAASRPAWAWPYFRATLAYIPALGLGLLVDGVVG